MRDARLPAGSGERDLKHCPNPECEGREARGAVAEYRDRAVRCGHCGCRLAEGPAPPDVAQAEWRELVTVASYLEVHQAYAAQSALRAAGLHAVVPDQHYAGLRWDHAIALGGVRVCVPADEEAAARELLAGVRGREVVRAARASAPATRVCPGCDSPAIQEVVRGRVPGIVSLLLLGIPLLFVRRRLQCRSCGCEYAP